jgi:flagellar hook-associated protein 2
VIHVTLKSNAAQESALNASITNENSIIATQTAKITAELNSANQTLQAIPTLLSEVSVMYSAITGYNQYHP